MWDVQLDKLLRDQSDLVAWWQLLAIGWNRRMIEHHAWKQRWRAIHRGVYATCRGPLTRRQRLIAAVLTAPSTYLHSLSATDLYGFHAWEGPYETVVRAGSGGKRRYSGLHVARSLTLGGDVGVKDGLPIVRPERALIDVAALLGTAQLARAFREACRLRCTTPETVGRALHGQRGTSVLVALCDRYATIPYHRCRSDAECHGLEVLHDAGTPLPKVNVRVAGREADYVWREWKLIIEVHSKEFHPFEIDDADKKALWESAGYRVRYIWADQIYHRPQDLLALVNVPDASL